MTTMNAGRDKRHPAPEVDRPPVAAGSARGEDYITADDLSCRAWPHTLDPGAAAQVYAARGWRVFPLHAPERRGDRLVCSCGRAGCDRPGKHPRTCCTQCRKPPGARRTTCTCGCPWAIHDGLNDASADPEYVARWWERWPTANVGIATGTGSDVFVLDLDCKPDREARDAALGYLLSGWTPDQAPTDRIWAPRKLPMSAVVSTGSFGLHIYMRHRDGLTNSNAGLRKYGLNIDVRGDGGYVVAPPSLHISGHDYQWSLTTAGFEPQLAAVPDWLLEELVPPKRFMPDAEYTGGEPTRAAHRADPAAAEGVGRRRAYCRASIAGILRDFAGTRAEHNNALYYATRRIAELFRDYRDVPFKHGWVLRDLAGQARQVDPDDPLSSEEIARTMRSALVKVLGAEGERLGGEVR
jgi:Bifunctional DNA primase/polymerase, N-terminal